MAEYINKYWIEKDLVSAKDVYKSIEECPLADVVEKSEIMDLIKRGWSAENIIKEIMRD